MKRISLFSAAELYMNACVCPCVRVKAVGSDDAVNNEERSTEQSEPEIYGIADATHSLMENGQCADAASVTPPFGLRAAGRICTTRKQLE